jgi:hypothetical protein
MRLATRAYANRREEIDTYLLGVDNLPGGENRFPGDRDFNLPWLIRSELRGRACPLIGPDLDQAFFILRDLGLAFD